MSFQDRINQIMLHYKLSAKDLASITGVQRSAISHLINGRNKPSVAFITQLTAHFTDLNVQWLLHGKGELVTNVIVDDGSDKSLADSAVKRDDNESDTNVTSVTDTDLNLQMLTQPIADSSKQNTVHKKHVTKIICVYSDGSTSEFIT